MKLAGRTFAAARFLAAALVVGALVPASAVAASPPSVSAFFSQEATTPGTDVGLGFTVVNTDAVATLTGVAFDVTLPAGLVVSTPSQLSTTCDGTATAVDGGTTISLGGASLQPAGSEVGASCGVLLDVVAASPGDVSVVSGPATSIESGPGSPSPVATLRVLAQPTVAQSVATSPIRVGETTTVTFAIANPNASTPLYNLAFEDALPAGLRVASPSNAGGTCLADGTVEADPGGATIALLGLQVAAGASCSFSVDVAAVGANAAPNATGPLAYSYDGGGGDLRGATAPGASATLVAIGPPVLTLAFGAASVAPGATTSLTFSLANPNPGIALTGVGFSAALPAGLVVATPTALSGSCGAGTITALAGTITLSDGTLAAGASCVFSVAVTAQSAGSKATTTSAVSSIEGGTGPGASASLLVAVPVPPPPPAPPAAPRLPSNAFRVSNARAASDGTVRFDVAVAGRGEVLILETLGASSERVRTPGPSRFTFARKTVRASKAAKLHVKVTPNARGRRAVRRAVRSLRVSLWVSFRPSGGRAGTVARKTVVVRRRR